MLHMYISFNVSKTFLGNVPLSETQIRTRDLFAVCVLVRVRARTNAACAARSMTTSAGWSCRQRNWTMSMQHPA